MAECVWPWPNLPELAPWQLVKLDEERIARRVIELLRAECPELFRKDDPA